MDCKCTICHCFANMDYIDVLKRRRHGHDSDVKGATVGRKVRVFNGVKLELHHIPTVPEPETAENASLLLEESLRKQKMQSASLPKAITGTIWKPLAVNAVFAGLNTIAFYIGPLLISSFVNFLTQKNHGSSYQYGLVLAFIFFFSKTAESLTQRLWYFGAKRIGIRVRAALTVLIYKKSLSTKFVGPSSGKIINLINVDAEGIGDFCWYIHGVWLLPIQVFLALVILHRNLGAAPSVAAIFATIKDSELLAIKDI